MRQLALSLAFIASATAAFPQSAELEIVRQSIQPFVSQRAALDAGWKPFGGDEPLMGQHYVHPDAPDYVGGDALDFSRPNNLMYTISAAARS